MIWRLFGAPVCHIMLPGTVVLIYFTFIYGRLSGDCEWLERRVKGRIHVPVEWAQNPSQSDNPNAQEINIFRIRNCG